MTKLLTFQHSRLAIVSGISLMTMIATSRAIAAWVPVSKTLDNNPIYIDDARIVRQGNLVEFWRRNLFKAPEADGAIGVDNFHAIECKKGLFRWRRSIRFDQSGRIVGDIDVGKNDKLLEAKIQSGSIIGDFYQAVCPAQIEEPQKK